MTPETIVALSRYFDKESTLVTEARAQCQPGEHKVKGAVQIAGVLKIGEPYTQQATPRLSGLHALTLMVSLLVIEDKMTKQAALALVERVLVAALTDPVTEEDMAKSKEELVQEMIRTKAQIQKRIGDALPREPRSGMTTFKGLAEESHPDRTFARAPVT